eukprot:scaffold214071_cov17-Tisochrysis_lutea.AAC.2
MHGEEAGSRVEAQGLRGVRRLITGTSSSTSARTRTRWSVLQAGPLRRSMLYAPSCSRRLNPCTSTIASACTSSIQTN